MKRHSPSYVLVALAALFLYFSGNITVYGAPFPYAVGGTGSSTVPAIGQIFYAGANSWQSRSTTTVSCGAGTSCSSFTVLGSSPITITSSGAPGGSNTQIQFNDSGSFGGSSFFTFDKTLPEVTLYDASLGADFIIGAPDNTGNILGVTATTSNTPGGSLVIQGGDGTDAESGGNIDIIGGSAGATADGSDISIRASDAGGGGNGNGGNVLIVTGNKSGAGSLGTLQIQNNSTAIKAILDTSALTVSDKTFTFPDASGTLCLVTTCSGSGTFPFTPTTSFGTVANSTSTLILLTAGLSASSTVRFGDAGGRLLTWTPTNSGRLGVGTSSPIAILDVGGQVGYYGPFNGTNVLPVASFSTSTNQISGVQFVNASGGSSADFRFVVAANDNISSVSVFVPSTGNTQTLFGQTRSNLLGLFGNASSGNGRILTLGNVNNNDVLLGTNNIERARLTATGNLGLGTSSPYALLSVNANNGTTNTTVFAISSSTQSATTTLFSVSNIGSTTLASTFGTCLGGSALTTNSSGTIVCGTITAAGDGVGNWFTPATNYAVNMNSTTTPLWLKGAIAGTYSLAASSTAAFDQIVVGSSTATTMSTSTFFGNLVVNKNASSTSSTISTNLTIPYNSTLTPTQTGLFGQDTTDNQLKLGTGAATAIFDQRRFYSFGETGTTSTNAITGSTTIAAAPFPVAGTITQIICTTDTGTVDVKWTYGPTPTQVAYVRGASTTPGVIAITSNNTPGVNASSTVIIGTPASSPTTVSCTATLTISGT